MNGAPALRGGGSDGGRQGGSGCPTACAERTARVPADAYRRAGAPERFRFELVEGGHVIEEAAHRAVLVWFDRWLIQPGG